MNLILTMAGRYSRFIDEGYRIPKYLLPWGNKSILNEIISELNCSGDFDNIYLVANKRDNIYAAHVRQILKALKIPVENLFFISDTQGQAESAHKSIEIIKEKFGKLDGNIVFHNIDTILYKRKFNNLNSILKNSDGYIDVFKSNNHNYSYVLVKNNNVESIAEKIVISNNASSGLYAFKNAEIFNKYYSNETLYISDIYKKMVEDGRKISVSTLYDERNTIVLGTPSEYLTAAYIIDL